MCRKTLICLVAASHRRLNKHSMSILAVEGPAWIVHCVNQSLEAHWLHSSLVYFKAKGWAVLRGASTLPPYQQVGRFSQPQHSHREFTLLSWRQLSDNTDMTSAIFYSQKPSYTQKYTCVLLKTRSKTKQLACLFLNCSVEKLLRKHDNNDYILCRLMAKIQP